VILKVGSELVAPSLDLKLGDDVDRIPFPDDPRPAVGSPASVRGTGVMCVGRLPHRTLGLSAVVLAASAVRAA
jgi:hypothetical protein